MTLGNIWISILLMAALGATLVGAGVILTCLANKRKIKQVVSDMLTSTGAILVLIAFYAAFIVATTELVITVTRAFN